MTFYCGSASKMSFKVINFISDARAADFGDLLNLGSKRLGPLFAVIVVVVENVANSCEKLNGTQM
jgi:hypothetical protein